MAFRFDLFNRTEFLYWYHITKYQNPIYISGVVDLVIPEGEDSTQYSLRCVLIILKKVFKFMKNNIHMISFYLPFRVIFNIAKIIKYFQWLNVVFVCLRLNWTSFLCNQVSIAFSKKKYLFYKGSIWKTLIHGS